MCVAALQVLWAAAAAAPTYGMKLSKPLAYCAHDMSTRGVPPLAASVKQSFGLEIDLATEVQLLQAQVSIEHALCISHTLSTVVPVVALTSSDTVRSQLFRRHHHVHTLHISQALSVLNKVPQGS